MSGAGASAYPRVPAVAKVSAVAIFHTVVDDVNCASLCPCCCGRHYCCWPL